MTQFINKSVISDIPVFEQAVKNHIGELESYEKHVAQVKAGKADPYPAPAAHPLVDASVARIPAAGGATLFRADYKIVDRMPVFAGNPEMLAARKDELRAEVAAQERVAMHAILPMGKWRLAGLRANAAQDRLNKLASKDGDWEKAMKKQAPEDRATLAEAAARAEKLAAVHLHHAELEAEIEDLDFGTINDWTPQPFEGNAK